MQVEVILFGLHGERLNVPPLTLEAHSASVFDIRDWATAALAFQQGSLQVHYAGRERELAGFVKIVRLSQSLIFDEQLTEPEEYFKSSRLEGVWGLPSERAELSIVVSNTSASQVSATIKLNRQNGKQQGASAFLLGPHETQVFNAQELVDDKHEVLAKIGGISINHSGPPGSLFAESLVQEASTGYSSVLELRDPQVAVSARLDGAGLRIGPIGGEQLTQVAVARNISDTRTIVTGRVVFRTSNGDTGTISIPEEELDPGAAKTLDLAKSIKKSGVSDFDNAGLEFQYTGAPGGVVMTALSMSESGNQVFRVPLVDAKSQKINTGKYPWSIDGSSLTVVYLKNVTDEAQEYSMYIRFPGGAYVPPLQRVEAGQTVTIDPTKLRDQQIPDEDGKKIPLTVTHGYLSWSAHSTKNLAPGQMEEPENQVLIGRSENVDITNGLSFTGTYGCGCQDSYQDSRIEHQLSNGSWGWAQNSPPMEIFVSDTIQLRGRQLDGDTCGNYGEWHAANTYVGWGSTTIAADDPNGPSVVVVDENGLATAQASGTAQVGADWFVVRWLSLYECCEYQTDEAQPLETISVLGRVSKIQYQSGSTFNEVSDPLYVLKDTTVTFKAIPNPDSFVWPSGKPVWGGTSGATGTGATTSVTFNAVSSSTTDFKTVTATYGNTVTVKVIVFDLTGVLTPDDNFSGRSLTSFGIHEHITLGLGIAPSGITASQVGGIQWVQNSGTGQIDSTTTGTGTYDVSNAPESATLLMKMLDGPSKDSGFSKSITVVAPSGGYVQKFSGIRHFQNWWSCGFLGDIFILPQDVSFLNLFFKEEDVGATANGWLSFLNGSGHSPGPPLRIGSGNINTGARVVSDGDQIFSGKYRDVEHGPYASGTDSFAIPWDYSVDFSVWHLILTANQTATSTATGRCTISKQGSVVISRELSDPDSEW